MKDFESISLIGWTPNVLAAHPNVPAKSVMELIALAKAQPGKITFASSGTGSSIHLAGELFMSMAGVEMLHVPYKGAAPALADLIGGQVNIMFDTVAQSLPQIKAGKIKVLRGYYRQTLLCTAQRADRERAVCRATRWRDGSACWRQRVRPGMSSTNCTPRSRRLRLEVRERMIAAGVELGTATTPQEFHSVISTELPKYAKATKDAGMKQE